jgi:hypothetical protein
VTDYKALGGEGSRTPVSYAIVHEDPARAFSERILREETVMEMPGWRWMLLVLLLGGERLERSGIVVLEAHFSCENAGQWPGRNEREQVQKALDWARWSNFGEVLRCQLHFRRAEVFPRCWIGCIGDAIR